MGQARGSLTILINKNHQESFPGPQIKYDLTLATLSLLDFCLNFFYSPSLFQTGWLQDGKLAGTNPKVCPARCHSEKC